MHCDTCHQARCKQPDGPLPALCPMEDTELFAKAEEIINQPENIGFFRAAAQVEAEGYCRWPRVREVAELCQRMGWQRIGLAFCTGFQQEAAAFTRIMRAHHIEVVAAVCKMGSAPKEGFGIPDAHKVRPSTYEVICNPVAQALYLNKQNTPYNLILGLCLGHDALFTKYSKAPASTLVAKDRALANNPVGALYCAKYCEKMLFD